MILEKFNFGFSSKVIGQYPKSLYIRDLIDRVNDVSKRIRWKYIWFKKEQWKKEQLRNRSLVEQDLENQDENVETNECEQINSYGFRTEKHPPKQPELSKFEDEVLSIMTNIQFRLATNDLQRDVTEVRKRLKETDKVIIESDKTTNYYSMSCYDHDKKLLECITAEYKKGDLRLVNDINSEAMQLAQKLGMEKRIQKLGRQ